MRRAPLALIPLLFALACSDGAPTGPTVRSTQAPPETTAPPVAPLKVTHTVTMTASPSCTALPEAAKKRSYPARLDEKPNGTLFVFVVNSTDMMVGWANESGFAGTRDGNRVTLVITDGLYDAFAMIERIPGVGDMGYSGTATGTIDRGTIVARFDGQYRLGYGAGPVLCQATDHLVDVTPLSPGP